MEKIWTEDEILRGLIFRDYWVIRALIRLYNRQTEDEKKTKETFQDNNMGFNKWDSGFLSAMAERAIRNQSFTQKEIREIRRRIIKYKKQLTQIANYEEKKKKRTGDHGYGLKILEDTAEKYGGHAAANESGGIFTCVFAARA